MRLDLDSALQLHATALDLRAQRTEILANNMANADTPGFKARDIDFASTLAQIQRQGGGEMTKTSALHLSSANSLSAPELLYRTPMQQSSDGNTVDSQIETAAFTENSVRYQASLEFLNSKIKGLMQAVKGE
jgi:flagellar basal-body rod protein FlgB